MGSYILGGDNLRKAVVPAYKKPRTRTPLLDKAVEHVAGLIKAIGRPGEGAAPTMVSMTPFDYWALVHVNRIAAAVLAKDKRRRV